MNSRAVLAALAFPMLIPGARAQQVADPDFTVGDIKVEGLQRITAGTVYNYLPVNIGDRLNAQREREAIRALYATGFFKDIELRRDGSTLVVAVLERPSIESIEFKGNKDLKTEDLQKSLRTVGLSAGKTFNRATLDEVTQYLTDQYYSRGKYAVKIEPTIEDQPNNRVKVNVKITEGSRAKIRQIDLVGNTRFTDKEILDTLSLKTPNWLSWYKSDDRYARETLQGDLEKVASYYQDRGYANFRVDSAQVAIAPDKSDIFITVNVTEGDVYKLGEIKIGGTLPLPEAELRKLLVVQPGQIYSQKNISATQELFKNRLGAMGFYFAKVDPVPTPDEANKTVALTLFVDPGNRVYVRHIAFTGTTRSNDETLRREMRQLEGALLSNAAVERSKQRLQRQPFVEDVDVKTDPVAGSADLVDVTFNVKERSSATIGGGIGWSASQKFMLNANFSDSNFLGTGDRVGINIDSGRYNKIYSLSHTDPDWTLDGISRTLSLSYRSSTQYVSTSSNFDSTNLSVGASFGVPISEVQGLSVGLNWQHVDLLTVASGSALQAVQWVQQNGNPYERQASYTYAYPDGTTLTTLSTFYGSRFSLVELAGGWSYDSRNRALFADRGQRLSLGLSYVPPGSNVRYWLGSGDYTGYIPLPGRWVLQMTGQFAYGKGLGDTTGLPPYKRMYAGGPDSVRGYTESTLGPADTNGNPYGGNMLVDARAELILPLPEKWQTSARATLFYDMGNVFSNDGTQFVGRDLVTPVTYGFAYDQLKRSTGVALQWLAPQLGIFRFSYGIPLNRFKGDAVHFADSAEGFQFSVGQSF
ncbi:MAG TPA: outer membrane protein assembly factor BamA [Steroidobacteraceae bacterium]|nr:outer membrane protein assembly factor BamA [Steroidobacteraceae bacterium]